jgi:hypothetical protein
MGEQWIRESGGGWKAEILALKMGRSLNPHHSGKTASKLSQFLVRIPFLALISRYLRFSGAAASHVSLSFQPHPLPRLESQQNISPWPIRRPQNIPRTSLLQPVPRMPQLLFRGRLVHLLDGLLVLVVQLVVDGGALGGLVVVQRRLVGGSAHG